MGSDETAADPFAGSAPDCVARGEHSGHFRGEGYSDWGANWTAVFRQTIGAGGPAQSYDGSQFTGLSFWAAVGPELGEVELPLGITTLDVAWNGGVCTQCMDYYRTAITLDAVWKRYTVRFQDMTQSGVGDPLLPIRTDQLVGFILWPSGPFER
jgi:hypothetical protein